MHRELQHKIKSVGMSTFSVEEIKKVDAGGNKRAQAVWMARYNPSDGPIPTEGEVEKIRKFLKDKYTNKRWYDESGVPAATPDVQPVSAVPRGSHAPSARRAGLPASQAEKPRLASPPAKGM